MSQQRNSSRTWCRGAPRPNLPAVSVVDAMAPASRSIAIDARATEANVIGGFKRPHEGILLCAEWFEIRLSCPFPPGVKAITGAKKRQAEDHGGLFRASRSLPATHRHAHPADTRHAWSSASTKNHQARFPSSRSRCCWALFFVYYSQHSAACKSGKHLGIQSESTKKLLGARRE